MSEDHQVYAALEAEFRTLGGFILTTTGTKQLEETNLRKMAPALHRRVWIRGVLILLLVLGAGLWTASLALKAGIPEQGWVVTVQVLVYLGISFNVIWIVWALARGTLAAKLLTLDQRPCPQ